MKTFVTGATGFIGSTVTGRLLDRGEELKLLVRPESDVRRIQGLDVEVVEGDIRDASKMAGALKGCDRVYHVAGLYRLFGDQELFDQVNVQGAVNVIRAAKAAGVERVVYTSSVAAVGAAPDHGLADEETEWNLDSLGIPYVTSKWRAEQRAVEEAGEDLELVVVNPAGPIGAGDFNPTPTGHIVLQYLRGKMPFVPVALNNFVDVDDVAEGHLRAMDKGRAGQRYILGGHNMTTKELLDAAARVTGLRRPWALPYLFAYLGGLAGQLFVQGVLRRPCMLNLANVRLLRQRFFFSIDKARNELGWDPGSIETALAKSAHWFCENGYVSKRRSRKILARLEGEAK
ncbi:MAG: NAD-dependent epimerase/dehydratase family protein [Deltaproteobacteria bacterium]|nr:NAD-dependent epimerase/dehydratase family protein [Deltaproteobacteria bacterium]